MKAYAIEIPQVTASELKKATKEGYLVLSRGGKPIEAVPQPRIICRRRADQLEADVDVDLSALDLPRETALQLSVSAVLQDQQGRISYWALAHPSGKPDFHHPDAFVLQLPAAPESPE